MHLLNKVVAQPVVSKKVKTYTVNKLQNLDTETVNLLDNDVITKL